MNLKRIYISGPDAAGKSTYAAHLSKITGIKVTKFSYEPDLKKRAAIVKEWHKIAENGKNCILDRGWFGPFCYDGILGNQPYNLKEILTLTNEFVNTGGTIVFLTVPLEELELRLKVRGDLYIKPQQLKNIVARYALLREILTYEGIPYYVLDKSNG